MRVKKVNGEVRGKEGEKGEQIDLSALPGKSRHEICLRRRGWTFYTLSANIRHSHAIPSCSTSLGIPILILMLKLERPKVMQPRSEALLLLHSKCKCSRAFYFVPAHVM